MTVRAPLTKRLSPGQWMGLDALVAVVALALGADAVSRHHAAHPQLFYALVVLSSVPVALARWRPLPALAVVLVASVLTGVVGELTSTVTCATYLLYQVAVRFPRRVGLLALAAVEVGVLISFALTTSRTSNPTNGAFTALVQLTVWIIGDGVRRHRAYTTELHRRSVRQAITRERLRIARELHDVVAHALSVVAVQAGVGGHVIAQRPDAAARALAAIELTARDALTEMRYLVDVLRWEDDVPPSQAPSPGMQGLPSLVQRFVDSGMPVTLRIDGVPRDLPPSVDRSAYRIAQEALTNVVRHAQDALDVEVTARYADEHLVLEVRDDGRTAAADRSNGQEERSGHGLTGMRERVSLLGGELSVGPRVDGGFHVLARLPTSGAAA